MASRPLWLINKKYGSAEEKDELTVKKEWLLQKLQAGPCIGPNSLRIYREDVRALLITEFGAPISDLEVGVLLRQAFPKHTRKGKYYFGIGVNGKLPIDVAIGLQTNPQSLIAVEDSNSGETPMLKPMKKRAIEAWREENGRQKPDNPDPVVVPATSVPQPIVRPWPQAPQPPHSEGPPMPLPHGLPIHMDKQIWRQMLIQVKQPLPIPPLDAEPRLPGQPRGILPGLPHGLAPGLPSGFPPGFPPGLPGGTSMVPSMAAMSTAVSSMASMSTPLNNQTGARVDNILGMNRATRGRKRSVAMERGGSGKRRRRPEEETGMIDLAAAGGMTPHQRELSKIQPIILNFEVPAPKLAPPKPIEQRLVDFIKSSDPNAEGHQEAAAVHTQGTEMGRKLHLLPEQRPGNTPVQPGIVVTSYPDTVPQLHLPQPGTTTPAPGHVPPSIQTLAGSRNQSLRRSAPGGAQQRDLFKKPDIEQFEAVTGAKCFICRLAIPPNSKDFPTGPSAIVTCSRCKKVAFGKLKQTIEPIPKFPTACNAPLAEKMIKLRRAQAHMRLQKKIHRQRAMGIISSKISSSAPSSPSPRSPMPPSPAASLPPRSPGSFMPRSPNVPSSLAPKSPGMFIPRSPAPQTTSSLLPPSPDSLHSQSPGGLAPRSPSILPPRSPNPGPPQSPLCCIPRSPHCLQPRSPMSLPPRSPSSMPPSPQSYCHSYPASPSIPHCSRLPISPAQRQAELLASPAESAKSGSIYESSPEKQADIINTSLARDEYAARSPRPPPQLYEQSPASSTSSEKLSLPPGREQDDTTIRALLQLGRPADKSSASTDRNCVPVMVLQRGATPTSGVPLASYPQPFRVPTTLPGDTTSMPSMPPMMSAGGHLIPVMNMGRTPTSTTAVNALPPGYPTAALPFLVQSFSPGAIRNPSPEKPSPMPKQGLANQSLGQPYCIPSPIMPSKNKNKPRYLPSQGNYMMDSIENKNRLDSIVIVGTNCAGSSSITVGNDPKDNFVPTLLPDPKQPSLTEMYKKPGFHAFYCSCSGRQIMLLQCPDCDFVCNNLCGMELHIAAQRHAESRAKAASSSDVHKYADEESTSSNVNKYGSEQGGMTQDNDEMMSQSSVDTQSADLDTDVPSPRREINRQDLEHYPSHSRSHHYTSPGQDYAGSRYLEQECPMNRNTSSNVISTVTGNSRREPTTTAPVLGFSSVSSRIERSTPLDLRADREEHGLWSDQQDRSRRSVVVTHRKGSITEGTPLDLSGYSRTSSKDTSLSEEQYMLNCKLGNIGRVIEKSLPLDLSGNINSTNCEPWLENNSRPSSIQSNSSLGCVLERPPATIELSRLPPSSGRLAWPIPRASSIVPPPITKSVPTTITNPFLALSMHTARANKRAQEAKSSEATSKTSCKDNVTSVPSKLNIPLGVAAASSLNRPPSHPSTSTSVILPTTELTRLPPGHINLAGSPQRILNYQGGTISVQPSDSNTHVVSRTVLFSGGEPVPEVRIKQEPCDIDEPTNCMQPSSGGIDDQHRVRSSPEFQSSAVGDSEARKSEVSAPEVAKKVDDQPNCETQATEKQQLVIVVKQEVASAN